MKKTFFILTLLLVTFNAYSQTKPWLHVDGNLVKDTAGNLVTLRGVSIMAPEYANRNPYNPKNPSEYIAWLADSTKGWHSEILRIPVRDLNRNPVNAYNFI